MAPRPRRPELPRPLPTLARTKFGGPAGSRPRRTARRRAGTSWARPLPARGLPHVPLPLCSGGALTLAPGRNFPYPNTLRPARTPSPGGGASQACPFPEGPLCTPRAHPPARAAQGGSVRVPGAAAARTPPPSTLLRPPGHAPPPARVLPRGQRTAAATRWGGQRPGPAPATPPPPRCPGPARPTRPPALPLDRGCTQQVSLTRRRDGETHREK